MKKIPLVILTGPTAVGKTNLSIQLAKKLNMDIISADSMQIYKYMDIGSAKVTDKEMQGIKHYLIDEVKHLLDIGYDKNLISMQGIGYKEIVKYLEGEYSLDEAIEIIKRDSRRYAKRQITWFKRYKESKWFDLDK